MKVPTGGPRFADEVPVDCHVCRSTHPRGACGGQPIPLVINRDRRDLLAAIDARKVYRTDSGRDLLMDGRGRDSVRVDRRIRVLREHGLVHRPAGQRTYALTPAGSTALANALAETEGHAPATRDPRRMAT